MERNNRGHIVAIASSAGIMGSPYFTAYGYVFLLVWVLKILPNF